MEDSPATPNVSLEERLRFETLLADLSTRFVNLPADRIDREIEAGLKLIAHALGIDRCSVAEVSADKSKLHVTHAFAMPGVRPMGDLVLNETVPWYNRQLQRGQCSVMASIDELPAEAAAERSYCRQHGVKSSVLIPLAVGGVFLGVVGFAAIRSQRSWPPALVARLKRVGEIFAHALMRKSADIALRTAFEEIQALKERLEAENRYLREEIGSQAAGHELVGQSDAIRQVLRQAAQVAHSDVTVLLMGETGTGKEIVAHRVHHSSPRRQRPLVTVNCAALPESLVESELFGHEKGAYTGALSRRIGRFEWAAGSSLFLDEVGELSLALQAKLLRVLESKRFERVGGTETITADVRVIAATNRDLRQAVRSGAFRLDLYYRLNVFPIVIPPLRERREDIPALATYFLKSLSAKAGKRIDSIPAHSVQALQAYHWPGNVRELRNTVERAVIVSSGRLLEVELPRDGNEPAGAMETLDEMQGQYMLEILKRTRWRIRGENGAAAILGLKPTTLESRLAKLGIRRPGEKNA